MEVVLYALPMKRAVFRDESHLIDRVVEYVDSHFADGISLRDVAIAFAYSPAHLTVSVSPRHWQAADRVDY